MPYEFITLVPRNKDVTGQRFGRLVVLGPIGKGRRNHIKWLCQCDCGNTTTVTAEKLAPSGHTTSCGCLRKEKATRANTKHGMSHSAIYDVWKGMIQRCHNPASHHYADYGARGIVVCPEWQTAFESFFSHVSGLPHYGEKGYSLDRIRNSGPYAPDNVRWATYAEQNRNHRRNRMFEYGGKTMCLTDWATWAGMTARTLDYRLTHGWNLESALTSPVKRPKPK